MYTFGAVYIESWSITWLIWEGNSTFHVGEDLTNIWVGSGFLGPRLIGLYEEIGGVIF